MTSDPGNCIARRPLELAVATRSIRFFVCAAVVVGLAACLYFACWEVTTTWGARDLWESIRSTEQARIPIEVRADGTHLATPVGVHSTAPCAFILKADVSLGFHAELRHYLWFFGSLHHLPTYDATWSSGTSKSILVTNDFSWESYWSRSDAFRFRSPVPRLTLIGTFGLVLVAAWILFPRLAGARWRIRFSLRGLALFVAIFGLYCTLWSVTNECGVRYELGDVQQQRRLANDRGLSAYAIAPFVICVESPAEIDFSRDTSNMIGKRRRFCLWIPGERNVALYPRYLKTLD